MPINCFVGLMGSGKSFECVRSVIVQAILAGRTVVTNVDGINGDAIRAYCVDKHKADIEKLGQVKHCKNEDVAKADFLPHGTDDQTFCQPGDLVAIDEAWRFWGVGKKILDQHAIFFREHRHYVNDVTKVSCDLVLMVQDIGDLHRTLKVVVELTFKTTKLKNIGFNKSYRLEMWEGHKLTRSARLSIETKKYLPEIFPLYSSYSGGQGKEVQVDKRQNIFNSKKLWMLIFGMLVFGTISYYFTWKMFNGGIGKKTATELQAANTVNGTVVPSKTAPGALISNQDGFSDKWRYVGKFITKDGLQMAVVADTTGRLRLESPSVFMHEGYTSLGTVDNNKVTVWTGALPGNEVKK